MKRAPSRAQVVRKLVGTKLAGLGFKKNKDGIMLVELDHGVSGWIGLNSSSRQAPGIVDVNPLVGVSHEGLERSISNLEGDEFVPGRGSIGTNIGYLGSKKTFGSYTFADESTFDQVSDELVEDVKTLGLPFMRAHTSLPVLLEDMLAHRYTLHRVRYQVPVALGLLGRYAEGLSFLEAELVKCASMTDPATERFRSFADRFREFAESQTVPA